MPSTVNPTTPLVASLGLLTSIGEGSLLVPQDDFGPELGNQRNEDFGARLLWS